jgi:DNA-binding NarL/FixJ family response regulator
MSTSIKVLIADDHAIVREGLRAIIGPNRDLEIVGMVTSFEGVLEQLNTTQVDVLVLDLGGMGGAPLTFVTRLQREYPHVSIVVFSSSVDLAPELLQAGISGYVVKEELSSQLIQAIKAVAANQRFLSPLVNDYMMRAEASNQKNTLTPQELNVLKHLAQGFGTSDIAEHLEIDPRVVYNYLSTLRRKTGCTERIQLAEWYKRMYGLEGEGQNPSLE